MKYRWLTLLFAFVSQLSFAAGVRTAGEFKYKDTNTGEIRMQIQEFGETMRTLSVWVLCYDHRTHRNAVEPKWEQPKGLESVAFCLFRPRANPFNERSSELEIHYSTSINATCDTDVTTTLNLRKWCAPWQPGN